MDITQDLHEDGTFRFLPNRLNTQPVIMGGLTNDEMFATVGICASTGFVIGISLAFFTSPAMPIFSALAFGALGLGLAGWILRRWKRGRPKTWLWR